MPVSTADLWNLLLASHLASPVSLSNLQARFNQAKGADTESNAATVAQWLVAQGALSSYQAKVLLAGQPGPFIYGEYTVYDRVGSGRLQGMFRALHPPTRHRVMLWFHTGQVVQNKQWWAMVVNQIGQAAQVVHPYVARVYHLVDVGQFKFTAIEDLQGESADAQLASGPMHWAVAARMVRQAALGLARMHELKQLHGAIRPENLWIDKEENVKLLMTPLARNPLSVPAPIDLSAAQQSEDVVRQADYLAPEMGQVGQAPGPWTDIYALGCTFFHLLAGRPPFSGRDILSKIASHSSERIPSLESAAVPGPISQVLASMMAKEPARRLQRPRQVADALGQVLEQLDPAQLHWPASAVSNKLPEYESWLQPYQLATDSQRHWAPEIQTPPILAASLRSQEPPPGLEYSPQVGGPVPPVAPRSTAADVATSSRTWSGADPLRTTPPPVAANNLAPPRGLAVGGGLPSSGRALAPLSRRGDDFPQMIFPPDEADAVIPFAPTDYTMHNRGQRRMLFSAAAVAVFMMILLFLWLSMRSTPEGSSKNDVKGTETTSAPKTGEVSKSPGPGKAESQEGNRGDSTPQPDSGTQPKNQEPNSSRPGPGQKSSDSSSALPSERSPTKPKHRFSLVRFANVSDQSGASESAVSSPNEHTPSMAKPATENRTALWASPTHGTPLSLAYLAPGVQAALFLRPADLMHRADRDKIFAALGPAGAAAARELKSFTGASLADIEQLTIAWIDQIGAGAEPSIVPMYVFRFNQAADREKLKEHWEYASPIELGLVYQTARGFAVYLPAKEDGKVLVVGPAKVLQEVANLEGQPPPVQRAIEKLLRVTDDQRLVTLLWMPDGWASADDASGVQSPWQMLRDWADRFFGEDIRAVAVSAHLVDERLFLEMVVQGPLDHAPEIVAARLRDQLSRLPQKIDRFVSTLKPQPYSKPVLTQLPQMVRVVAELTRSGADGDLATLRCYLPAVAAHNLLMATELAVAESTDRAIASGHDSGMEAGAVERHERVVERLEHVTSLSFARDTLERAIQMLADDVGVKAEIIGPDLQMEGITKNQSFGLDEKDKPAAEILRVIMLRANPDGKLVYVVRASDSGDETLLITTRAAAAKRGDKLPPELAKAPAKK